MTSQEATALIQARAGGGWAQEKVMSVWEVLDSAWWYPEICCWTE